jgi:hypothetical protein
MKKTNSPSPAVTGKHYKYSSRNQVVKGWALSDLRFWYRPNSQAGFHEAETCADWTKMSCTQEMASQNESPSYGASSKMLGLCRQPAVLY